MQASFWRWARPGWIAATTCERGRELAVAAAVRHGEALVGCPIPSATAAHQILSETAEHPTLSATLALVGPMMPLPGDLMSPVPADRKPAVPGGPTALV